MTNRTINLTPSAIKALPVPSSTSKANDIEWSDEQTIGLKVLVGRTGNKRYLLRYVSPVTRKRASIALGRWPDLDVNDARTKARKLKVQIADGIDPKLERDSRSAIVMPDVYTFFHETYLPWAKNRKRSWRDDETRFLRCKPIYKIPMDRLSAHAIMKLQSHLATETYNGVVVQ